MQMINRLTTIQIKQNNETTNLSIDVLGNLAVIMGVKEPEAVFYKVPGNRINSPL